MSAGDVAPRRSAGRIDELDALRGLAALAVVLYHYTAQFPRLFPRTWEPLVRFEHGHYGVDLFFMISGFVIAMTLARTRVPADFLVSRFSRLYPAYWAALAATFAVTSFAGLAPLERTWGELAVNATMLQGHVKVRHVDGAYWSLTVELGFYAIMLGAHLGGWLRRPFAFMAAWLAISLVHGWVYFVLGWSHLVLGLVDLFLLTRHAPLFVLGMCFYWMRVHGLRAWKPHAAVGAALAVHAVVSPAVGTLWALAFTGVFYALAAGRLGVLASRPLLWLGGISYTLYLVHQYVGYVLLERLAAHGLSADAAIGVALLLVTALAQAITTGVERPAMAAIRRAYRQPRGAAVREAA